MSVHDDDCELDERFADWVDGRLTPRQQAELEAELLADDELRRRAESYRDSVAWTRSALLDDSVHVDVPPLNLVASVMAELDAPRSARRWLPLLLSSAAAAALLLTYVVIGELGGSAVNERSTLDVAGSAAPKTEASATQPENQVADTGGADSMLNLGANEPGSATGEIGAMREGEAARRVVGLVQQGKDEAAPADLELDRVQAPERLRADDKEADVIHHLRDYLGRYRVPPEPAGQTAVADLGLPVVTVLLPAATAPAVVREETKKQAGELMAFSVSELGGEAARQLAFLFKNEQHSNVSPPTIQPLTGSAGFLPGGGAGSRAAEAGEHWFAVQGDAAQLEDYVRTIRAAVIQQGGTVDIEERQPLGLAAVDKVDADKFADRKAAAVDVPRQAGTVQLTLYLVVRQQSPATGLPAEQPVGGNKR